jgi:hypothetical protein
MFGVLSVYSVWSFQGRFFGLRVPSSTRDRIDSPRWRGCTWGLRVPSSGSPSLATFSPGEKALALALAIFALRELALGLAISGFRRWRWLSEFFGYREEGEAFACVTFFTCWRWRNFSLSLGGEGAERRRGG